MPRTLTEVLHDVRKEVDGVPSLILVDGLPYKVIPTELADELLTCEQRLTALRAAVAECDRLSKGETIVPKREFFALLDAASRLVKE